jgi:hypothetical protein
VILGWLACGLAGPFTPSAAVANEPPPITLGAPILIPDNPPPRPVSAAPVQPTQFQTTTSHKAPSVRLGDPVDSRTQSPYSPHGYTTASTPFDPAKELFGTDRGKPDKPKRETWKFGEWFQQTTGIGEDGWIKCDHGFDGFISPVTNPFLFEDPRALTELRPIFFYQKIPSGNYAFSGGNIPFFGLQARLAVTDRFSLTLNRFGFQSINGGSGSVFDGDYGFSEIWLGPKYTFLRNEETGTLGAAGAIFQVPIGSGSAYQNTGTLSIAPYVSFGKNFFQTQAGSFNALGTAGYSFSVNKERSDYFYLSGHIDFDLFDRHRFYPLIEANYFYATTNGNSSSFNFEGRDAINFGARASGSNLLTLAPGFRYKISEKFQFGAAYEFPLVGDRDLFRYRFTIDFIWRY